MKLSSDADNLRYDIRTKRVTVGYGGEKFLLGIPVRGQGDGASYPIVEHSDDIFFDANRGRVYVLGEDFIETWQQKDPDHYELAGHYPTPASARTGLFVPEWERLFVAVPHDGTRAAEILEFETK